jgi:hypothetical protein
LFKSAVLFSHNSRYVNVARCDPRRLSIGHGGNYIFHVGEPQKPTIFVTPIKVNECFLQTIKYGNNNKPSRFISGGLFSGEFERAIGAIGMILNKPEFGGQYYLDCLSFSTSMPSAAGKILLVDLYISEHTSIIYRKYIFVVPHRNSESVLWSSWWQY